MLDDRPKPTLSLAMYHNLLNHIEDAVIVVGFDSRVMLCNSGAERLLCWTAGQMIGQTFRWKQVINGSKRR